MNSKVLRTWSFNVVDMHRTATQRKKLLAIALLIIHYSVCVALVAVAFVDCLKSLLSQRDVIPRPRTVANYSFLSMLAVR